MTSVSAIGSAKAGRLPAGPVQTGGRTTVASRALDRVVSAVAAESFGVTARSVRVDLSDRAGLLAVSIRTPVSTVPLERIQRTPSIVQNDGAIVERAANAQAIIRERVTQLTGTAISHVTVEITGIDVHQERRVV